MALRSLAFCLALLIAPIAKCSVAAAGTADPFPRLAAAYLVQINGTTVWAHAPDRPLPPASLTKMMTGVLVLEQCRLEDTVTVSSKAAGASGNRLGLNSGDRMRLSDLVAAMLLQSANDACLSLAEHAAGSEAAFVNLMNERARKLGMRNTRFVNPCGHDDPRHLSTAEDLALLANAALGNDFLREIVGVVRVRIATIDGSRTFALENKNELIGRYRGAIGVKTGTTSRAGECLVALAERGGERVLLVLLDAKNRWWNATAMLDRAFASLQERTAGNSGP